MDVNHQINTTEYGLCKECGLTASAINDEVPQLQHKVKRNWVT